MGSGQFIDYNDAILYAILWTQIANQQKQNDAFHVKTTLSFFVV